MRMKNLKMLKASMNTFNAVFVLNGEDETGVNHIMYVINECDTECDCDGLPQKSLFDRVQRKINSSQEVFEVSSVPIAEMTVMINDEKFKISQRVTFIM